uniref:Uncharacterized protein n=1 Tax=Acrobeloides nanus TaxID=290746 RepID=A0A914EL46_9BILA
MHHAVVNSGLVDISGKDLGIVSASTLGCVATPTPMPGVAESPLMTWGEIEGTPFRLDGADISSTVSDDAPAFKIPEVPLRERIAQEISDTIAKRYRDKRKFAMEHVEKMHAKTPKFGSVRSTDKLAIMSPAARRLANNKLGIRIGTNKFLKSTYSPRKTPGSTRSTIYSPAIHKYVKVKKEVKEELRSNPPSAPSTPREYVTDDLLHLPSPTAPPIVDPSARPSASDFF